jgi:DNA-3-methyladenine glycosylase II
MDYQMNERIIFSNACLAEGTEVLSKNDKVLREAFKHIGPLKLRLRESGFSNLVSVIVSQQISVAAADAILKRMGSEMISSEALITTSTDEKLKEIGLSRQKIKYVRALASAKIDYDGLEVLEADKVIEILTDVLGIGRWTAEIYLMFSLGRANIFPAGDLALQEACRILYKLPERPNEKKMRNLAIEWAPWMSVAARGLWSYYSYIKKREGIR